MTVLEARARYLERAHNMRVRLQIAPVPLPARYWWEEELGLLIDAASITLDNATASGSVAHQWHPDLWPARGWRG